MKTLTLLFGMLLTSVSFGQEPDSTKTECCEVVIKQQEVILELDENYKRSEKRRYNLWRIAYAEGLIIVFMGGVLLLY